LYQLHPRVVFNNGNNDPNNATVAALNNISIWNVFLPLDVGDYPQTAHIELVELSDMSPVWCPGFSAVEERREHHSSINSYIFCQRDAMVDPQAFV